MNAKILCLLLLLFPIQASAQGFAGLGMTADGFSTPKPDPVFNFPDDHGPHPDYRIEWWYLTANMTGPDGMDIGLQWTLFRTALAPEAGTGWSAPQLWLGHAALTTPTDHYTSERFARGGIGQAGVTAAPFQAWIDDWTLEGDWTTLDMTASGTDFSYDIKMQAQGPMIFHGQDGYSVKSADGQASYYYSQPFLSVAGIVKLPIGNFEVTGTAWIDREWSSQPLSDTQTGWDWFSLSFDSGDKLMGFRLRQTDGSYYTSATWINADGTTQSYPDGAFDAQPLNSHESPGAVLPTRWRVTLPDRGVDIVAEAINPNAWMPLSVPYWEGPIRFEGSHQGRGYLEMTGYDD